MDNETKTESGHSTSVAEHVLQGRPAPKWAAVVGDRLFPMPRRNLTAGDILDQAGGRDGTQLVRDHGGTQDVLIPIDAQVDLGDGNVFRLVRECARPALPHSPLPAKLAFVCDDEWKITLIPKQTGRSLKHLFGVSDDAHLFRDFESPHDQPISDGAEVSFHDGPVFTLRTAPESGPTMIIVNGREKSVMGRTISYSELVVLAFGAIDSDTIYTVTFKHGPPRKPEGSMVEGDVVKVQCGMIFNVTPTRKS